MRPKRVLLIDAVVWAPGYPAHSPFRDVASWYGRWLKDLPDVAHETVSARRDSWRPRVSFDLDQTLDQLRPTPVAGSILRNFVVSLVS
jgi:hypothetical protein